MNQPRNQFEDRWPALQEMYSTQGVAELLRFIDGHDDLLERRSMFLMASQRISSGQGVSRTLDDMIQVSRAAIDEFASQSEAQSDPDEKERRLDGANMLSYNLAADLAPCWPEDEEPRLERHFREGIRCATDCLRWREELSKGPVPFSIAWWALGAHRCGLSDWAGACEAFQSSLDAAKDHASEMNEVTEAGPGASFSINIATGWLEFARWRNGDESSYDRFLKVVSAFSQVASQQGDLQDDALQGIQQLETAATRLKAR